MAFAPLSDAVNGPRESPNAPMINNRINHARPSQHASPSAERSPSQNTVGSDAKLPLAIALSGGGVRSAVFCAGALEAFMENGIFEHCSIVASVSGGGFAGAALLRAMQPVEFEKKCQSTFTSHNDMQHVDSLPENVRTEEYDMVTLEKQFGIDVVEYVDQNEDEYKNYSPNQSFIETTPKSISNSQIMNSFNSQESLAIPHSSYIHEFYSDSSLASSQMINISESQLHLDSYLSFEETDLDMGSSADEAFPIERNRDMTPRISKYAEVFNYHQGRSDNHVGIANNRMYPIKEIRKRFSTIIDRAEQLSPYIFYFPLRWLLSFQTLVGRLLISTITGILYQIVFFMMIFSFLFFGLSLATFNTGGSVLPCASFVNGTFVHTLLDDGTPICSLGALTTGINSNNLGQMEWYHYAACFLFLILIDSIIIIFHKIFSRLEDRLLLENILLLCIVLLATYLNLTFNISYHLIVLLLCIRFFYQFLLRIFSSHTVNSKVSRDQHLDDMQFGYLLTFLLIAIWLSFVPWLLFELSFSEKAIPVIIIILGSLANIAFLKYIPFFVSNTTGVLLVLIVSTFAIIIDFLIAQFFFSLLSNYFDSDFITMILSCLCVIAITGIIALIFMNFVDLYSIGPHFAYRNLLVRAFFAPTATNRFNCTEPFSNFEEIGFFTELTDTRRRRIKYIFQLTRNRLTEQGEGFPEPFTPKTAGTWDVGSIMTTSAAIVASRTGWLSSWGNYLYTFFNFRLGMWATRMKNGKQERKWQMKPIHTGKDAFMVNFWGPLTNGWPKKSENNQNNKDEEEEEEERYNEYDRRKRMNRKPRHKIDVEIERLEKQLQEEDFQHFSDGGHCGDTMGVISCLRAGARVCIVLDVSQDEMYDGYDFLISIGLAVKYGLLGGYCNSFSTVRNYRGWLMRFRNHPLWDTKPNPPPYGHFGFSMKMGTLHPLYDKSEQSDRFVHFVVVKNSFVDGVHPFSTGVAIQGWQGLPHVTTESQSLHHRLFFALRTFGQDIAMKVTFEFIKELVNHQQYAGTPNPTNPSLLCTNEQLKKMLPDIDNRELFRAAHRKYDVTPFESYRREQLIQKLKKQYGENYEHIVPSYDDSELLHAYPSDANVISEAPTASVSTLNSSLRQRSFSEPHRSALNIQHSPIGPKEEYSEGEEEGQIQDAEFVLHFNT
ncbi:hypothetical protein PCE1_003009 [Barthelona sp. PCE]